MEALISCILISAGFLIIVSCITIFLYQVPVRISFAGSLINGSRDLRACIGWGLIDLCVLPVGSGWHGEVRIGDIPLFQRNIGNEVPDTSMPPEKETESPLFNFLPYIPLVRRIISELIHHIRIGNLNGDIRFGAGDPVTTGLVYGYYHAFRPLILISAKTCSLDMVPDFNRLILEGEVKAGLLITRPFGLIIRITAIIIPVVIRDVMTPGGAPGKRVVHA